MNIRTPITALAVALCLACTPALATQPSATGEVSPSNQATQDNHNVRIISIVRKVYSFKELDRNHNGMLSRAEIPRDMVNLRRDFVRADFDGNGQLSPEEYVLYSKGLVPQYVGVFHYDTYTYSPANRNLEVIDMATP